MEQLSFLVLYALSLPLLLYCSWRIFCSLWWKPKALEKQLRRQGISGNPYRLLYGDMKEEIGAIKEAWSKPINLTHHIVPRAVPFIYQTVQRYGKTSTVWFGTTPRVIICEPEMMREVLMDKQGQIQKPPGMIPAFLTCCVDMVKRWQGLVAKSNGSCEIDIWPEFQNLTGDVISRTAFGSSYQEGKKIFELQKEQAVLVIEAARVPYIPGFRFLPTAKNRRRMNIDKQIKGMLREMIDKKLGMMRSGESIGDDLLGLLLQLSSVNNNEGYAITIEDVIEECKLFYFAGQETTSVWLTWTLVLLANHPMWQRRAREEVIAVCGRNKPDFESTSHLKIVTMILYEVLRLYPPVVSLFRTTIKNTKLGEFVFPAGVDLWLPTILIHHDREFWGEDAEEFNPERFSEGVSKASKVPNAFFPWRIFYSLWWKPKALEKQLRRQGISGNPYRLLYGDLKEEIGAIKEAWSKPINLTHQIVPRVAPFIYQTVQKYGKTSIVWVGMTPRVIICEPEMIREVLTDKLGQIQKPPANPLVRLLAMGVVALEGEEWATRRRAIIPAFHLEKLKLHDMVRSADLVSKSNGSCEIDVWPELQNLTGDVISRTAFGSSYQEGKKIFELQKEQAVLALEALRSPYIPGFRFLPTAKNRRRKSINKQVNGMLREMIDKRLSMMRSGESIGDDLLGLLLQLSSVNNSEGYGITIEDVIEECKLFYFAGQETTSVWLTWTLVLLANHPMCSGERGRS
ncbi:Cytochrome P450 72A15 [Ananas comosus]|uniref:Cytochrome P450 72A15 n=1 Tax=Ananas comosus TaxID=4615 RepID=A0A199VC46_ANACO|nr:Cytochrome P450 72A15 [Ananas comosus]